jgi:hypothetical protein
MSGAKNYALYREELTKISVNLPLDTYESGKCKIVFILINSFQFTTICLFLAWQNHLNCVDHLANVCDSIADINSSTNQITAVVPHLAAHLGALTGIFECHMDYLPENVHLLNVTKWKLCSAIVIPLLRFQKMEYHFRPLRAVVSAYHACWRPFFVFSCYDSIDVGKVLFELSVQKESALLSAVDASATNPGVSNSTSQIKLPNNSTAKGPITTETSAVVRRKSAAYDKIKTISDSSTRPPTTLKKSASQLTVLQRMFSLKSIPKDPSVNEEEDDDDISNSEESSVNGEISDDEEKRNDDDETEDSERTESKQGEKKSKSIFNSILKKIW